MARDTASVVDLNKNAMNSVLASMTSVNATNGLSVPFGGDMARAAVLIIGGNSADFTATVTNGVYPPALRTGIGDAGATAPVTSLAAKVLSITVPATGVVLLPLESARFSQSDGSVYIDFQAATTAKAVGLRLPR